MAGLENTLKGRQVLSPEDNAVVQQYLAGGDPMMDIPEEAFNAVQKLMSIQSKPDIAAGQATAQSAFAPLFAQIANQQAPTPPPRTSRTGRR